MSIWRTKPKPQPIPVKYRAIAVILFDENNNHIADQEIELLVDGQAPDFELTNSEGYALFLKVIDKSLEASISIEVEGYEPYSQTLLLPLSNHEIVVGDATRPDQTELPSLVKKISPILSLTIDDRLFKTTDGNIFSYQGVTAFPLLNHFDKGIDIDSFIKIYDAYNTLRIFPYVPVKDWGITAWDVPHDNATVGSFLTYCADLGKRVSLDIFTDEDSKRLSWGRALISYLKDNSFTNLTIAAVNEPLTHKKLNPQLIKSNLEGSGYLYTSGVYEDLKKFFGKYGIIHTDRGSEWPCKAKGAIEAYNGGGPNYKEEPACKVPWILGEPIRPDQARVFGNDEEVNKDYYSYGALARLCGAGIEFHCESAKLGNLPSEFELACSYSLLTGYNVFPEDAVYGDYEHEGYFRDLEEPNSPNPKALRIYRVGNYIIVIRPKNFTPPPTWIALDTFGVCYKWS